MQVIRQSSPNCNSRDGHAIDMLVLHYTGMKSGANALDRMCDPTAEVSAHYMIEEDGRIFQLVDEEMRAWHAGKSYWRGHTNINQRSIGIEIVNPGHEFGYRAFPEVQMQSVVALCKEIVARHNIPARNVVGHSDVAPTRKEDPGELFDWKRLSNSGVGLLIEPVISTYRRPRYYDWLLYLPPLNNLLSDIAFYHFASSRKTSLAKYITRKPLLPYADIQEKLAIYGYDCPQNGVLDEQTRKAIIAFQRHFRPKALTGKWDRECENILQTLLDSAL